MKPPSFDAIALLLALAGGFNSAASAQLAVYSSLVDPLPGNVFSQCFECDQVNEFGDKVTLAPGTSRRADSVVVTLSSQACETGGGTTCKTKKGKTFTHPVTLKLYDATLATPDLQGTEVASVTANFKIPFRPSADPSCPGGTAWRASPTKCYNGLAFDIEFDLRSLVLTLPETMTWSVTYDTQTAGYNPLGVPGPYNSLNVGLGSLVTVGADVDSNGVFMNTSDPDYYCDGGAGGVDTFRNDTSSTFICWAPYVPAAQINVMVVPTDKDQCKKDGWMHLIRPDGSMFNKQKDCEKFVQDGV